MSFNHRIRRAVKSDSDALGIIGPAAYAESYGHMWSDPAALASQLASFGAMAVADFLSRGDTSVWIAEVGGRPVGFLTLILHSPDRIEGRSGGAEVQRIYLLRPARGARLAAELVKAAEAHARSEGMNHLWLDVMAEADWARRVYAKWGFVEVGRTVFPGNIIDEFKEMVVMRRDLHEPQ